MGKGMGKGKGKGGQLVWIIIPMILTLVSLILLIIIGAGCTNKDSEFLNSLYFMRANTSDIQQDNGLILVPQPQEAGRNPPSPAEESRHVQDFYHVGLWNYCSGTFKNQPLQTEIHFDNKKASKTDNVTDCTKHHFHFWFNLVEVWGLNQTVSDVVYGKELGNTLATYKTVTKWMNIAYVLSSVSLAIEFLFGVFAMKSRRNMLITTVVSILSSLFLLAFALTSTILYASLVGTFNHVLTKYNIHGIMGFNIYLLLWLAVACSWITGFIWLFCSFSSSRFKHLKGYEGLPQQNIQNVFLAGPGNQYHSPPI
jgi:hypothetical protein